MTAPRHADRPAQQGAALLVLLSIILLTIGYTVISGLNKSHLATDREAITTQALMQAKEALIGYAMSYPENHNTTNVFLIPGHLPCPDTASGTNEGIANSPCGATGVSSMGYLPWQTLNISPLKDADGNCLWYAVSGNYKTGPKANLLNWDTVGQFRIVAEDGTVIAGSTPASQPIAVIFAPGPPVNGQNRSNTGGECGKDYNAAHFLDSFDSIVNNAVVNQTAEGVTTFAARGPTDHFNDRLLWITQDDLFTHGIEKGKAFEKNLFDAGFGTTNTPALAQRIAACITVFGNSQSPAPLATTPKRLPWASPIVLSTAAPNTFQNDNFADSTSNPMKYAGRVPFRIRNSQQVMTGGISAPAWLITDCDSPSSPGCRLLRTDHCTAAVWEKVAGSGGADSADGWWDKWKDQFFYAVAADFNPTATSSIQCPNSSAKCIYVDNDGPFAAVIIFAGHRQGTQVRDTLAQKNNPQNYLEGINAAAIQINNTLDPNFGKFTRAGNDQFVCINPNLTLNLGCSTP